MKLVKLKCENCGAKLEVNSELDNIKCSFCGAEIMIDDEASELNRIEDAKLKSRKKNHEQDLKERQEKFEQDLKEKEILERMNAKEAFKKGKFSKVLLVFFAISVLLFFAKDGFFAKFLALIQAGLFICSWLMGMEIIKEPKKGLKIILAIAAFVLVVPVLSLGNNSSYKEEKPTTIDIAEIELKEKFPEPNKLFGRLSTNRKDLLIIEICDVSKKEYKEYVNGTVAKAGYTLDLEYEDWDTVYGAYDKDGYNIRIIYDDSDSEMHITLTKPEKMEDIEWPTTGLGSLLPAPKSLYANISWNNSDTFIVHVGNTEEEDYNAYVKECENLGYTIDYSKEDKYYSAKNSDGYELHLRYLGGKVMEISLEKEDASSDDEDDSKTTTTTTVAKSNGLRSDFKKAMDDYEKFIDRYVAFMKKFNKNPSDLSLINDYAKYMEDYSKMVDSFEKWDDEDLNDAEMKYYLKVQTSVTKKLASLV